MRNRCRLHLRAEDPSSRWSSGLLASSSAVRDPSTSFAYGRAPLAPLRAPKRWLRMTPSGSAGAYAVGRVEDEPGAARVNARW